MSEAVYTWYMSGLFVGLFAGCLILMWLEEKTPWRFS